MANIASPDTLVRLSPRSMVLLLVGLFLVALLWMIAKLWADKAFTTGGNIMRNVRNAATGSASSTHATGGASGGWS